jgi:isoleucyl-tRNA synthetase
LFNKTFEGVNKIILDHLEEHGKLWKAEPYTHEYPHNWRTGAPLIYYLRPSWYFNTNAIRDLMVAANDKVTWYPDHVKEGRFGEWLKNNVDWAISRERFWGTPLPFFVQGDNITTRHPVGYHKPQADDAHRTPEVLDCWFDSGAMPFAAYQEYVQADFICEATDQTRGWFYALMAIGVAVKGESPFKTVLCLGHVLDKNGQKMSKTKGNVVDPEVMFQKYGADAVRWYMAKCPVGNSLIFNEKDVEGITKSFLNRLWNSFTFFDMYAKIETFKELAFGGTDSTDQWIFARRKQLIKTCADGYDNYNFISVALAIEKFVDDLSNVWIRANRSRFWNTDGGKTDKYAFTMLYRCLSVVCQVAAPIIPFITDKIWNGLSEERVSSVHLTDWPTFLPLTDGEKELVTDMELAQSLVEAGHKIRNEKGVKIRQALLSISVPEKPKHFEQVVLDELNIKQMLVGDLQIDFTMTEELLAEGVARDFVREIQTLRKRMGLEVTDRITMKTNYGTNTKLKERLTKHSGDISKKLLVVEWTEDEPSSINGVYVNLNEDKIAVEIVKK